MNWLRIFVMLKLFSYFATKSTRFIKLSKLMKIQMMKLVMNFSLSLDHILNSLFCHLNCQNLKKNLKIFLIFFKQIFLIRLFSHLLIVVLCCQEDFKKSKQMFDMSKLQILVIMILKSIKKLFNLQMQYSDKQSWKIKLTFLWKIISEFWLND